MIQSVSFTNAALRHLSYLYLLVSASAKRVIKFLGILKKYVFESKIYFFEEKIAMFHLIKKLFLSFKQFSNLIS